MANYELSATNRKFDFGRKLTSTKFAPGFQINLTSVGELTAQGYKVLFEESEATVTKDGVIILRAKRVADVFRYMEPNKG